MKARILGLMATSTVLSIASAAVAQQAGGATEQVQRSSVAPAVVTVRTPAQVEKAGRDMLKNPDPQRAGTGDEQPVFGWHKDEATGRQFVTTVFMESADRETNPKKAHMTLRCASYEMLATEAPKLVAESVIQEQEGRRTAHHPCMSKRPDKKGRYLVGYGNDFNQNSPSHYVTAVDHMCNKLAAPVVVSVPYTTDDGNSGGCSEFQPFNRPDGNQGWIGQYLVTNAQIDAVIPGNLTGDGQQMADDDIAYVTSLYLKDTPAGVEVVKDWHGRAAGETRLYRTQGDANAQPPVLPTDLPLPAKDYPEPVISPADIGRGQRLIQLIDNERYVLCAPYGNDRPSMHIECAIGSTATGTVQWRSKVLVGDGKENSNMAHWNQASIEMLSPNRIALHALAGNGRGKNTDIKGSSVPFTFVFDVVGNALVKVAEYKGAPVHGPHSSICTGKRGAEGQEKDTIFAVSQPHTGVGSSGGAFLGFDTDKKILTMNEKTDKFRTAWYADGQLLSNYLGENPMNQGRNYSFCIGDVPNLGYQVEKGWMKDVKSFFVTGVNGRQPGFARNAYWLSFVAGVTKYPVASFVNPVNASEAQSTPPVADPTPAPAAKSESSSGCGCSTPGSTNGSNFAGGLLLLGLALGGIAARRRS